MAAKTWFITGTSRGFGRVWAQAALARGDRVAATARDISTLAPLVEQYGERVVTIQLDVTQRPEVQKAVAEAHARLGGLDVIVNNAGYGLFGAVEEITGVEARAQFETNFFGALWVTQAALPYLRAQRSGHLIQISSIGGVSAFPAVGLYNASKWALEGLSQSLAAEVAPFGIKVTLVEPAGYATDWGGSSARRAALMPAYAAAHQAMRKFRAAYIPADPEATGAAMLRLVDAQNPPLRVFFGSAGLTLARAEYARRLAEWEQWNDLSIQAQGDWLARQRPGGASTPP